MRVGMSMYRETKFLRADEQIMNEFVTCTLEEMVFEIKQKTKFHCRYRSFFTEENKLVCIQSIGGRREITKKE